jgi:hypothetical protein
MCHTRCVTVFRFIRDVLVCLACLCVLVLTAEAFYLQARLGQAVSQFQDQSTVPDPLVTGCPFGPDACGG